MEKIYTSTPDGERELTPEEYVEWYARQAAAVLPVADLRHITEFAFRMRFTNDEKVAMEMASIDNPELDVLRRQEAARLRVYIADLRAAQFVDLDLPDTRTGVLTLEAIGIIAAGRGAQILDADILAEERFYH